MCSLQRYKLRYLGYKKLKLPSRKVMKRLRCCTIGDILVNGHQ